MATVVQMTGHSMSGELLEDKETTMLSIIRDEIKKFADKEWSIAYDDDFDRLAGIIILKLREVA